MSIRVEDKTLQRLHPGWSKANALQLKILDTWLEKKKASGRRCKDECVKEFWAAAAIPKDITAEEAGGLISVFMSNIPAVIAGMAEYVVSQRMMTNPIRDYQASLLALGASCRGIYERLRKTDRPVVADQPAQPEAARKDTDDLPF
jgi:hypothetical protein